MAEASAADLFPLGEDDTPYRKLTSDHVSVDTFKGQEVLTVDPEGLRLLSEAAFADINHLLRPAICSSLPIFLKTRKQRITTVLSPTIF